MTKKILLHNIFIIVAIFLIGIVFLFFVPNRVGATKLQIPLYINIIPNVDKLTVGDDFQVTFEFWHNKDTYKAKGEIQTSGVVNKVNIGQLEWENIPNGEKVSTLVTFNIGENGEGDVRWSIDVFDEYDRLIYGRGANLYFFAPEEGRILTSTSSLWILKYDYFYDKLKMGKISETEFEKILGIELKDDISSNNVGLRGFWNRFIGSLKSLFKNTINFITKIK